MHFTCTTLASPEKAVFQSLAGDGQETTEKVCLHGVCNCPASPGSDFCSPYCAGVGETTNVTVDESQKLICDCGHPTCVG